MTAPTTDIAIDDPSWPGGNPSEVAPGLMLCAAVTVAAFALAEIEQRLFGHPWLEPLVVAILVGAAIRAVWSPGPRWTCGINFGAKTLLDPALYDGSAAKPITKLPNSDPAPAEKAPA